MFVVKQVPVCSFIAFVVLRKAHVHLLFTLEIVGFPECSEREYSEKSEINDWFRLIF